MMQSATLRLLMWTGVVAAITACAQKVPPAPSAALPTVRVATVLLASSEQQGREEVVGTVRARLRATLEAKVSGRIDSMNVQVGQRVSAGALVARLAVQEIQARLEQAEALREQAEGSLTRFSALLSQQAATQQQFDAVKASHSVAVAAVAEAKTMLDYAAIRAPFSGVITHKLADVGDLATPGRPLVELEDTGSLRLEIAVPESLLGFLELGARVPIRIATLPNLIDGTVSEIAPSADPFSRTFLVKVDLPSDQNLRTGQFGRALIPTGRTAVLRVPPSAIVKHGQMEMVFVVHDGLAHLRLVRTGKRIGSELEVASGLEAGEQVVVSSASRLVDQQPVEM